MQAAGTYPHPMPCLAKSKGVLVSLRGWKLSTSYLPSILLHY